jgi:hypothetical protein
MLAEILGDQQTCEMEQQEGLVRMLLDMLV